MHLVECFSYSSLYAHQRVKISLYSPDIVVIADFWDLNLPWIKSHLRFFLEATRYASIYIYREVIAMYGWRKRNTSLLREAVNYFNHLNYLFKETIYSNT